MSNVYHLDRNLFWKQTPAAQRQQWLRDKWDALPEHRKEGFRKEPGLFESLNQTPEEDAECNEIIRRLGLDDYADENERHALVSRLAHLDPYLVDKRCHDWIFRPQDPEEKARQDRARYEEALNYKGPIEHEKGLSKAERCFRTYVRGVREGVFKAPNAIDTPDDPST